MAVYVIHFEKKFHHTQHYIGYTEDVEKRKQRHLKGHGSSLMKAVTLAGIKWDMVHIIPDGDRTLERTMKNQHNHKKFCPICNPARFNQKKDDNTKKNKRSKLCKAN